MGLTSAENSKLLKHKKVLKAIDIQADLFYLKWYENLKSKNLIFVIFLTLNVMNCSTKISMKRKYNTSLSK